MNMHRRRHPGSMWLIILVLGALLGACGVDTPSGKTVRHEKRCRDRWNADGGAQDLRFVPSGADGRLA